MPRETPNSYRRVAGILAISAAVVSTVGWALWRNSANPSTRALAASAGSTTTAVSALGQFAPMEPVTHVSAPYIQGQPPLIAKVTVAEGDHVRAGQAVAVLAGREQLQAAVQQAAARVQAQQIKLQQSQQAPLPSDVAAHAADVKRWQEALRTSQADFERYTSLRATHDVSLSDVEQKRNEMVNAQQMLDTAMARQAALTEHHDQDIQSAQAELKMAQAELERARFDAANAEVHAPADGIILQVLARPGEQVGPGGIIALARTAQMDVIAEVYETDISRVRMGEHARVTSDLLPVGTTLQGTVVNIGKQVAAAAVPAGDSAAFADVRVVNVRIRLDDGAAAANLIGGKASVVLEP